MTANVDPTESDQNRARLQPQRHGFYDLTSSMASIQHPEEAVDLECGNGKVNDEIAWIQNHIKMRRCTVYIPSEREDNREICQCGYHKKNHDPIDTGDSEREVGSSETKLKWDFQKHTKTEPTNAFGEIEFVGFGGNAAKFIRVDEQTDKSTILHLMMKVWRMEKPNLLISVTGGAQNFNMKPRLRDVFQCGLMKAAHSTGAWIITGGTNAGVMKHVGKAVKDYGLTSTNQKHVVIGIASWGIIQNRNALEGNKQGSCPAQYRIEEHLNPNECFLDPNHSHFILVDNGTQHEYATEIPFRAELERKISEMQTDTGELHPQPFNSVIIIKVQNFVSGQLFTICDMVCRAPQLQEESVAWPHWTMLTAQRPCPVWKWFSVVLRCRGRLKPCGKTDGTAMREWFTTYVENHLSLHAERAVISSGNGPNQIGCLRAKRTAECKASTMASMTMKTKLLSYISDGWNIVDVITISLFIIGMTLRSFENPHTLEAARVVLGVNLVAFFLRLLHIFSVHRELGPKLLMIIRMVHNMTYFVVILFVFIVAYAIASHAVLYPNTELSLDTLLAIFRQPYWTIHGELMLDEIEGVQGCTADAELYGNGTLPRCPTVSGKYFVLVMKGVYVMMCNILLLNLLIAMFSYTIQMVQENSDMHWYFQRYRLIHEYYNRPFLAPPLILIVHVFLLIRATVRKCWRCCTKHSPPPRRNAFCYHCDNTNELCDWEGLIADSFHHNREIADQESIDNRVKTTASRLDQLVNKIDELQVQQQAVTVEDTQSSPSQTCSMSEQKSNTGVEPGSTNLGRRIENIEKQLQWIVESLKEHQPGASRVIPDVTDGRVEETTYTNG